MARTADEQKRVDLLERIVDYVMANGLSDLSLRPLADAVGSTPRVLLYYFTSKEALIASVMAGVRERQRAIFDALPRNPRSYADTVRAAWALMSDPKHERVFRLFFEVYGLAQQGPLRFPDFAERAVHDWLAYLGAGAREEGHTPADARAIATILLAGYRGFLLDLCATGDRKRIDRAVGLWLIALDAIPSPKKLADAKHR